MSRGDEATVRAVNSANSNWVDEIIFKSFDNDDDRHVRTPINVFIV